MAIIVGIFQQKLKFQLTVALGEKTSVYQLSVGFTLWRPFTLNSIAIHLIVVVSMATNQSNVIYKGERAVMKIHHINESQTAPTSMNKGPICTLNQQ